MGNQNLVEDIHPSTYSQQVIGTGEEIEIKDAGVMNRIGEVLFAEDGITNIISTANII